MISFVLFPQASQPSMNFDISELVYLKFAGSLVSILAIKLALESLTLISNKERALL